ncbi:MAG: hypothetical protein J7K49_01985 [Thaumarchaeota archaeon]|nr:hypothetical protein [Nitrososphaerota archaeon]
MKKRRAQVSPLTTIFIISIVLAVGVFLWSFTASISQVLRMHGTEELNDRIKVLRSRISADYVFYPAGEARLRNIGNEPIVVYRLIVYNNGSLIWDSGIQEIARINIGKTKLIRFSCPGCKEGDPILLVVYYTPEEFYNTNNPKYLKSLYQIDVLKVASFTAEPPRAASSGGFCPLPEGNWSLVDFVDPKESGASSTLTRYIKVKLPDASTQDQIRVRVTVSELEGSDTAWGEKTVPSESNIEQVITLNRDGLTYPIRVNIESVTPDWTIIQSEWRMDRTRGHYYCGSWSAHVDYVKLLWNKADKWLVEAFVKVFYSKTGWCTFRGRFNITVKIYDCHGSKIAEGNTIVDIEIPPSNSGYWDEESILIYPTVSMFDVYRIDVEVEKVG